MSYPEVEKTFSCLAADIRMIAQKTELWTEKKCSDYLEDIKAFMDSVYLKHVYIVLKDAEGNQIKARRYDVLKVEENDIDSRPGDNNWDKYAGKSLNVILSYGYEWDNLNEDQKKEFKARLNIGWSPSTDNTSFTHLRRTQGRTYQSGQFGIQRIEFD
ncbi:MAG: hypothetical protein JXQ96_17680 [Cyclobacteriaceae bacterium]